MCLQKVNKVSFWTHSLFPYDSNILSIKFDSLNKDSKHNLLHSNNNSQGFSYQHKFNKKHSKLCNKPKQHESYLSSSEESSLTINGILIILKH